MALCFRTLTAWATRPPTPSPPPTFTQLKKGALLGDFDGLVGNVRAVRAAFSRDEEAVNAHLAAMKLEVQVGDNWRVDETVGGCKRRWQEEEEGARPHVIVANTPGDDDLWGGVLGFGASLCFGPSLTPFPFPTGVQALLVSLEGSYYSSQHRGRLVTTGASQELQELCQLAAQCQQTNKFSHA